jgi:ATP-dependent Lhr-like helicase
MILRAYCIEDRLSSKSSLSDELRENLVQTIAMIRLLARGWYEPLDLKKIHASTLVQQILSAIGQHGGMHAHQLWDLLCGRGPFSALSKEQLLSLLRKLGGDEIIFQDTTGLLLLAPKGERITEHYTFYAAFSSDEEYRVVAGNRVLGSLPISRPLVPGAFVIFAGRRWQVISVSEEDKVIAVQPATAGTVPGFDGGMSAVLHDGVRREMQEVLRTATPVPFLDHTGQALLQEARENYARRDLDHNWIVNSGTHSHIILWVGDRLNDTLALMLLDLGFEAVNEGLCVTVREPEVGRIKDVLGHITSSEADPVSIASAVQNKCREKWDYLLPADLLDASFASSALDVPGMKDSLSRCL